MNLLEKFNYKLNNLSNKNKIILFLLLLVIFVSLSYIISITGDYSIEYSKNGEKCIEEYDHNKLITDECPEYLKTKGSLNRQGIQYGINQTAT